MHLLEPGPMLSDRLRSLARMVGNTPLLALEFLYRGSPRILYAKSEHLNITGSIKDRMALHILRQAYAEGKIHPGDTIAEATSGNTGISFAALGRALGHPVTLFMPDWMSRERTDLISCLGAQIVPVSLKQGGFLGSIALAEKLARQKEHVFLPRQFSNEANVVAHEKTTGPEIWWQLQSQAVVPDAFVAGVGTGGTIMGVGRFLRSKLPSVRIHPLEPKESPILTTGHQVGHHRIQGISDEFIPTILNLGQLDPPVAVHDGDAILMAQKLASQIGLGVGISSGANLLGALMVQNELGGESVVVTVFPDDNKKYLSTDLLRPETVKRDYLTLHVEFTGFHATNRVCTTCWELSDSSPPARSEWVT